MLDKALGDDLRHCLGGLKPCQLGSGRVVRRRQKNPSAKAGRIASGVEKTTN
jgi:hypothetical protein